MSEDDKMDEDDTPIEAFDGAFGAKVVKIEDLRVARGMSRRERSACKHTSMIYDDRERRIWCDDCQSEVHPFDAFTNIVERLDAHHRELDRRQRELREAESYDLRRHASKAIDEMWRQRSMVPCCPHCSHGLLPELFAQGGISMMGRDYAEKQLARARAEWKAKIEKKD